jgi:two-component system chemotaxis response regulator CheV
VLAEDSPTIREAMGTTLRASGYTQLTMFENGAQAWAWVEERLASAGRVEDVGDLVIADVEMPQIDGFHLTRRIKEHPELKRIPVLLYSSIITPDNQKKGQAVGADAQVAKPELTELVRLADELIGNSRIAGQPKGVNPLPQAAKGPSSADSPVEKPASVASCEDSPAGIDPNLWPTFHDELTRHCRRLRELLVRSEQPDRGEETIRDILRTLHTIKAASMVLPLERVTRCTHLVEARMENARTSWPENELGRYLEWLEILLSPPSTVEQALSEGGALEAALAG